MSTSVKNAFRALIVLLALKSVFSDGDLNSANANVRFATPCDTPNGDNGLCVEISKCPSLQSAAQSGQEAFRFIEASKCGPANENSSNPRVCCGKHSRFVITPDDDDDMTDQDTAGPSAVLTSPFPSNCGHQNVSIHNRIVGGIEAALGDFPWLARLRHLNQHGIRVYGCSGFLIHEKYVLTAAHCVKSTRLEDVLGPVYEVQLGEHDTYSEIDCDELSNICADPPQIISIRRVIAHPSYDITSRNNNHDIAIIHLSKKAIFNDFVQPICISSSLQPNKDQYWVSGWGATENQESSSVKRMVSLPAVNFSECTEKYRNILIQLKPTQICAGAVGGKDSCSGDSGGPLMQLKKSGLWYAEGVVSFGVGCARPGWPGVYTYIPRYYSWIRNIIIKREQNDTVKKRQPVLRNRRRRFYFL